jgi:hypothetical protein
MSLSLLVTSSQLNSMSSGSSLSIRLMCLQMMLGMMGDRSTMSFFLSIVHAIICRKSSKSKNVVSRVKLPNFLEPER